MTTAPATPARRAGPAQLRRHDHPQLRPDRSAPAFRQHTGARLDRIGRDAAPALPRVYLLEERKLAVGTVVLHVAALRFFFCRVLKRRDMKEDLPYPKRRAPAADRPQPGRGAAADRRREESLSPHDAADALRRRPAPERSCCQLKVADIDSQRMVIRVERGKGGHDREVPLSPTLLAALREYYRWMRPQTYLFPGHGARLARRHADHVEGHLGRRALRRPGGRDRQARQPAHACGTRTPRICWKPAPTCARFRCCSATPTSRTRRSICICRGATCRPRRIRSSNCRCRTPAVLPRSRLLRNRPSAS